MLVECARRRCREDDGGWSRGSSSSRHKLSNMPNGTNGVGVAWKVKSSSVRGIVYVVFGVGSSAGQDLNLTRVEVNRRRRYRGLRYRGRMECELQCK